MNLGKIAKGIISKAAPLLGTLVAGPAGGSIGAMIASALGVEPTESAIEQALKTDPQAAVKLAELESNERVRLQELAAQQGIVEMQEQSKRLAEVNATMRAEGQSEHWPQWSWRPFWGFISALAFMVVCVFICILAYRAVIEGDGKAMAMIPQMITSLTTLFAVPGAIVGVTAWHRGKAKVNAVSR